MEHQHRTILIIDDNPDDLEFYAHLLKTTSSGIRYTVLTAETAAEGLALFTDHPVDCTFIDFNMPGEDGLSVIDALQRHNVDQQVAMALLTGEPHQHIQAEAARHGALDYVSKDKVNCPESFESIINKLIDWTTKLNTGKTAAHG